ncbi:MAG: family 20 glycosylhydrolase [Brevinematia bacterium]
MKRLLSSYIDGEIAMDKKKEVEEHLSYCYECRKELIILKKILKEIHNIPEVSPSENFSEKLWIKYISQNKEPYSLCPIDPRSTEFLEDLFGQLLPHFSSNLVNVGMDETFDLGKGRSKEVCEKEGTHEVYVKFLGKVNEIISKRHKKMQYWGDIILEKPELIPKLPKDAIALVWGYEVKFRENST